jgi:hypothetical protein
MDERRSLPANRRVKADTSTCVVLAVGACLSLVACDKFMRLDVSVTTSSGAAVAGASVQVAITKDGRELSRKETSERGVVTGASSYGFRSGPRTLTISKRGYKTFAVILAPHTRYSCHVVLVREVDTGQSTGRCEEQ